MRMTCGARPVSANVIDTNAEPTTMHTATSAALMAMARTTRAAEMTTSAGIRKK
jgi:hypothetical protein